ncbi:ABC transporter permease [Maledivibacter halophilus]|uniref:Peptide/nickel transport system permease protein n=1 Tax=Maledivibacter halophilus TaxID=36842 RepID=A0A1T5LUF4_9FIRM|nr:ABC transporter permease [Maledivibacter halophilus]SKC79198.1 peptide/nickel transport system permease protein [Maledivibacter halophilus]
MKRIIKIIKNFSVLGKLAFIVLILIFILSILGPQLSKHSHDLPSGDSLEEPSKNHKLGTDGLGIDILAQICNGGRISIIISFGVAVLACSIGSFIGILSGYKGGAIDYILMRFTDMMIVLPQLPTMIVLGAFFGPSIKNIIIVLSLFSWTPIARITRSRVLTLMEEDYIKLSKGYGGSFKYIYINHIQRDLFPIIMLGFIRTIGKAVVTEASLSFLGLGDPTSKSWGLILNRAMDFKGIYFTSYWKWWVLSPLLAIILVVLSVSLIGREMESRFDFKM